jgi:hypothetical protein
MNLILKVTENTLFLRNGGPSHASLQKTTNFFRLKEKRVIPELIFGVMSKK